MRGVRASAIGLTAALGAIALGVAGLLGGSGAEASPAPDPIRVAFGSIVPEGTPWANELKAIKTRVEKESGGRMKVALFLGGRRGSENDMLVEVRRGKLQGAALSTGSVALEVPELQALEFPFLFRDGAEVDEILEGPIGRSLAAKVEERGLFLSIWGENGWRSIASRARPVLAPKDLVGMKVRAQESRINAAFWRSVSVSAVQIPLNEVPPALKTGLIDGFDQTPIYMVAGGWDQEVQHFTLTEHSYQGGAVIFNKRFLESLPDDLRALLLKDADIQGRRNRTEVRQASRDLLLDLAKGKMQIHRLDEAQLEPFRKATACVYDEFAGSESGRIVDEIRAILEARRARERSKPPEK